MIFYPLETLLKAGIKQILIIVAPDYAGHFLKLLGSGKEWGAKFTYEIQDEPRGLADAYNVGADFIGSSNVTMILGDNIFENDFSKSIKNFNSGGKIFVKEVPDPERYGVVEFDKDNRVLSIEEKPKNPKSNFAAVGLYIYDNRVIQYAKSLSPSNRGELEITDLHKKYLETGELSVEAFDGFWEDAGTFDSLLRANNFMYERNKINQ